MGSATNNNRYRINLLCDVTPFRANIHISDAL